MHDATLTCTPTFTIPPNTTWLNAPPLLHARRTDLFRSGALGKLLKWCDISIAKAHRSVTVQSVITLTYTADVLWYRERLRDLGMALLLVELVRHDPDEWEYIAGVYNLSRSESIHITLQEADVLGVRKGLRVRSLRMKPVEGRGGCENLC